jgi:hypothetical protein
MSKVYTTSCIDCAEVIGYSLTPNLTTDSNLRCFTCMCTFTEFVTIVKATNLPDIYDTYTASHNCSGNAQKIRVNCMKLIERLKI